MARYKDMTGKRYGMLTVIEYVGKDKFNNALWRCKCDCGQEKIVNRKRLISGDTRSCGCLHERRLAGQKFGRLLVIEKVGTNEARHNVWRCKCDCGNEIQVSATDIVSGHTRSCGCLMRETSAKTLTTHGKSKERLYTVWQGMLGRCNRPSLKSYENYGGRGIKVCEEWRDYEAFREWAYANGYDENAPIQQCTIDRIDVNGDYEPSNCRWVDAKTQAKNKRPRKKGYKRGHYKKRKKDDSLKGESKE